jgi:hypothetical protein
MMWIVTSGKSDTSEFFEKRRALGGVTHCFGSGLGVPLAHLMLARFGLLATREKVDG